MPTEVSSGVLSDSPVSVNRRSLGNSQPRSVEAGPSSPRSDSLRRLHLTTSRDSETDNALLEKAINAKRRKSSLLPGVHLHNPAQTRRDKDKRKHSIGHGSHDGTIHGSPEVIPRDTGPVVADIEDHTETDEGREQEADLARLMKEGENARIPNREEVALTVGERDKGKDAEVEYWTGFPDIPDDNLEYVWEHLFENQRGLYAFGKAYFSALALLPADPTPWTVPLKELPAASSTFILSNPPEGQTVVSTKDKDKPKRSRRTTINTAFTPETFQLPSPDWEWITPWMINMRTGADEMGWRYNAWFKMKGWRSKAGTAGWGGWVRRREWVRLRRAIPHDEGNKEDPRASETGDTANESKQEESGSLAKVIGAELGNQSRDLVVMCKELNTVKLDREKIDKWREWLEDLDDGSKSRLQDLLEDAESRRTLHRQFTYRSSTKQFIDILTDHGLNVPTTPSTTSKPLSRVTSRAAEDAASQQGYDV